tara:strand:- start:886 stop:1194 length:309 start_codon:yes stop_codon:yes gene_type:complete
MDILATLPGNKRLTVGADKNYDIGGFVADFRTMKIPPHVARNIIRHTVYQISQRSRKHVEESFDWGKSIGLISQMKVRGISKENSVFKMIGWNLTRMRMLLA